MKRGLLFALFVITGLSISIPALAADWSGFYVGGHLGYGWGNGNMRADPLPSAATFINFMPTTLSTDPTGALLGGQVGYNWAKGNVLTGVEADISWSDIRGNTTESPIIQNNGTPFPGAGNNVHSSEDLREFGTLRGRLGYIPVENCVVYATGGLAWANVKYEANTDFRPAGSRQYPVSVSRSKMGWTLGLGTEWSIAEKTSIKAEYLYYDLGNQSVYAAPLPALPPFGMVYHWKTSGNLVRIGLNYKF